MSRDDAFKQVRDLVRRHSGVVLEEAKNYLVDARLSLLAKDEGLPSLDELLARLAGPFGPLHRKVLDAMVTNETLFFRDAHPFAALKEAIVPALLAARAAEKSLCFWSAACSTGQEPYSLVMLLRTHFPELAAWRVKVLATDLSEKALARARAGVYSDLDVERGLAADYRRYLEPAGAGWQVTADIRAAVEFRALNLTAALPPLPAVDVVFLRNVLIYFDVPTKEAVLRSVAATMRPDGWLFLGGSETTIGLDLPLRRESLGRTDVYRRVTPRG